MIQAGPASVRQDSVQGQEDACWGTMFQPHRSIWLHPGGLSNRTQGVLSSFTASSPYTATARKANSAWIRPPGDPPRPESHFTQWAHQPERERPHSHLRS